MTLLCVHSILYMYYLKISSLSDLAPLWCVYIYIWNKKENAIFLYYRSTKSYMFKIGDPYLSKLFSLYLRWVENFTHIYHTKFT